MDKDELLRWVVFKEPLSYTKMMLVLEAKPSPDEVKEIIGALKKLGPNDFSYSIEGRDVYVTKKIPERRRAAGWIRAPEDKIEEERRRRAYWGDPQITKRGEELLIFLPNEDHWKERLDFEPRLEFTDRQRRFFHILGDTNYILSKVRAGEFKGHKREYDVSSFENRKVNFLLEDKLGDDILEKYLDGPEEWDDSMLNDSALYKAYVARRFALIPEEKKELPIVFGFEDYFKINGVFGYAAKEIRESGLRFKDLERYFIQRHIEVVSEGLAEVAKKGLRRTFKFLSRYYIKKAVSSVAATSKGTVVDLETYINPFVEIVSLEDTLRRNSRGKLSLDYNDPRIINKVLTEYETDINK